MVRSHKKRSGKYRGSRTHGRGNTKKGRGKGNRGGVGGGGLHKHKWSYVVKYDPDHFGAHGFVNKNARKLNIINLSEINRMIEKGIIGKKDNVFYFKFKGKVLGAGRLLYPVIVEALSFSKKAVDKIEEVGGETRSYEAGAQ